MLSLQRSRNMNYRAFRIHDRTVFVTFWRNVSYICAKLKSKHLVCDDPDLTMSQQTETMFHVVKCVVKLDMEAMWGVISFMRLIGITPTEEPPLVLTPTFRFPPTPQAGSPSKHRADRAVVTNADALLSWRLLSGGWACSKGKVKQSGEMWDSGSCLKHLLEGGAAVT